MSNANDPIELLLNFSIASSPSGIETQEAQGQQNLVHSDALPIQGDWEVLKRWGVIQGEPIDKLFCSCTLPSDWKKVATNHSMWSNLLDSRGLIRASIFYKAAFYDRDAHFLATQRFGMAGVYQDVKDRLHGKHYKISDNGLNRTVFVGAPVRTGELEGKLVAVKNGKVYASTTSFQQAESRSASDVVLLTEKEFYGKWHNRDVSNYDFFKTIENLAKIECLEYLNRLPTDDSIWEDCFDFPGLDSLS